MLHQHSIRCVSETNIKIIKCIRRARTAVALRIPGKFVLVKHLNNPERSQAERGFLKVKKKTFANKGLQYQCMHALENLRKMKSFRLSYVSAVTVLLFVNRSRYRKVFSSQLALLTVGSAGIISLIKVWR